MRRSQRFDVAVIGAGPAGSTTAYRLAAAGVSVLLLDRARFPRDKPCGGGVTARARRLLPFPIDPVVEEEISRFEFRLGYRDRTRFERTCERGLVSMTQRRRLDAYLVAQAAAAGADFRDGVTVREIALDAAGAALTLDGARVEAAVLVGADGANGVTARSLGLAGPIEHSVALEGNLDYGLASRSRFAGRVVVELGTVPGGYGWITPKGDHVNVGVGGFAREGPRLREQLRRLCRAHALDADALRDLRGHRLPMRLPGARAVRGRALLVGDAAGLVDPLSGDGMFEAFLSGRLAVVAILDLLAGSAAGLEAYGDALARALDPLHASSRRARQAFDRFPRLAFAVAGTASGWRLAERVMAGSVDDPAAAAGLSRAPMSAVSLLASGGRPKCFTETADRLHRSYGLPPDTRPREPVVGEAIVLLNTIWRGRGDQAGLATAGEIRVRVRGGYDPDTIHAEAGVPLRVVFRREESSACSEQVVFPALGKSAMLPRGEDVAVDLVPEEPGEYEFTCAMGLLHGRLVVAPSGQVAR